jgi:hypothetical protein
MDRVGPEHTPLALSKTHILAPGTENSTQDGTPISENVVQDPDLTRLIRAWPTLPVNTKAAILALVQSTPDKEQTP